MQQPMSNENRLGPSNIQQNDAKESLKNQENTANIPEIIEERRRDSEGRTITNKYVRGKLLGKVNVISILLFIISINLKTTINILLYPFLHILTFIYSIGWICEMLCRSITTIEGTLCFEDSI